MPLIRLLIALSVAAFATTPDPCKTDAAVLGFSDSTAGYVRSIAKLADDGRLSTGALRELADSNGDPVDLTSGLNDTARHVWRSAFARLASGVDFNREDAKVGIARLALHRQGSQARRDRAEDETTHIVHPLLLREISPVRADSDSYLSVVSLADKPFLFWRDVWGLRTYELPSGLTGIHDPTHIGRNYFAQSQPDGSTLIFSASTSSPPSLHQAKGASLTKLELPAKFELRTGGAGPVALGDSVAAYLKGNPFSTQVAKPAVFWFKPSGGSHGAVHSVEIEDIETREQMAALVNGAHSFIALSAAKQREVVFVDTNAKAVHWKPQLGSSPISAPVLYAKGDGVRAVVSNGKELWIGDPVAKATLARVPLVTDGTTPIVFEHAGSHYAVAPHDNKIEVVDLDAGGRVSAVRSTAKISGLQSASLGDKRYLVWMEGPELVIADFASREIHARSKLGSKAEFHLYRKGDALHAVVKVNETTVKDYRLISEKGREQ